MGDLSELNRLIKKSALDAVNNSKPVDVLYGTVASVNPIKVKVDQKLTIGDEFLILTKNVTDYKTKISFDNADIKAKVKNYTLSDVASGEPYKMSFIDNVKHDITVYNSLKLGDVVILIRVAGGQKYIILDKVG